MGYTLPIPISYAGKVYDEIEIKPVCLDAISGAKNAIESGDAYRALQFFVASCTESISNVTDKSEIKKLVGFMPYKSAEAAAVKILLLGENDDGIEGVYECPRCGEKKICSSGENDTRDFIRDIEIINSNGNPTIQVEVEPAIVINSVDNETIESVHSLELCHPTLVDCSAAYSKHGDKDSVKLQLGIYLEAIQKVNGQIVDRKWKNRYGMQVIKDLGLKRIKTIGEECARYGMQTDVLKTCTACGKEYDVSLNTSSFFVSALAAI